LKLKFMVNLLIIFLIIFVYNSYAVSTRDYDQKSNPFSLKDYGYADPFSGFKGSKIEQPFLSDHYPYGKKHLGADFMAPAGTVLYSICDGIVLSDSLDMTENKVKRGRDDYDAYFNSRLFIQCESPKSFLVIYGHIDKVQNYLGEYYIGKRVYKGQPVGEIAEAYTVYGARNTDNDHLHFGINTKGIKFYYGSTGWGIAESYETEENIKAKGYVDPFEFLLTSEVQTGNITTIFDGAGSLVYPLADCFGCNKDIAIMHPNGFNLPSTVVFQWRYDSSKCPYLNLYSEDGDIDVYISSKEWSKNKLIYTFKYKLNANGVTIRRPSEETEWFNIVVTSQNPISKNFTIGARCVSSYTDVYKEFVRPTPEFIDVTGNYIWTGTGSLISYITDENYDRGLGLNKDYVIAMRYSDTLDKKVFASLQWYVGDNCKRITIEALCVVDKKLQSCNDKFVLDEIRYKPWYEDNTKWVDSNCSSLPCEVAPLATGYFIIKVKGSINHAPSLLKFICSE